MAQSESSIAIRNLSLTFSLAEASMDITERQTAWTDNAGLQSSVRIDRQMWPLLQVVSD